MHCDCLTLTCLMAARLCIFSSRLDCEPRGDKVRKQVRCYKKFPNGCLQDLNLGNVASGVANDHVTLAMSLPEHVFSNAEQRY